jgi:ATP/maltotriose-dependent transcriptional regulator MalT
MLATLALSNLGRTAAREGRVADARSMLEDAHRTFEEINARSLAIEAKTRLAECALLAGDPGEALALADETLAAIEQTGEGSLHHALVHRIRGYALAKQGELDAAHQAFRTSRGVAESADETYELALTLQAQARLAELTGNETALQAAESRALLARLGVVSTPRVPI